MLSTAKIGTFAGACACLISLTFLLSACNADTKAPTLADMQKMFDTRLKGPSPAKVTSSECSSAGGSEWKCEVIYEVFINNPRQLMLAGYYQNTIKAVFGPKDGELRMIRDYSLVDQRRIR